ncbi:hypothetical protein FOA52_003787 [Chlamydomonas sp. UWO 241]|nr:hypothetical protein FOA52_003787 [Chlamydomonas sp. UWO 241]
MASLIAQGDLVPSPNGIITKQSTIDAMARAGISAAAITTTTDANFDHLVEPKEINVFRMNTINGNGQPDPAGAREHFYSTGIRDAAQPNLAIYAVFESYSRNGRFSAAEVANAIEAFNWEVDTPGSNGRRNQNRPGSNDVNGAKRPPGCTGEDTRKMRAVCSVGNQLHGSLTALLQEFGSPAGEGASLSASPHAARVMAVAAAVTEVAVVVTVAAGVLMGVLVGVLAAAMMVVAVAEVALAGVLVAVVAMLVVVVVVEVEVAVAVVVAVVVVVVAAAAVAGAKWFLSDDGKSSQGLEELRAPATATYAPLDVRGVPEPYLQPQSQAETHGRLDVLKDEIQALTLQTGKLAESSAKLDQMMELCTAVSSKVDQLAESMAIQAQLNAVPRPTLAEASAQTDPQTMAQVASLPKQMHGGGANTLRKHPAAKRSAAAAADGTPATTRSMQGHRGEQGSKAPASADHQQLALRPESVVTSGQHGASSTPGGSPTPLPCWGTKRARHVAAPAALQQAAATPLPPVASQPVQPVQQHVARQAKASGSAHAGGAPRPGSTIPPPRPTAAAKPAATRAPVAPALSLMGSSLMLLLASAAPTAAPAAAPGSRKSAKLYGSDGAGAGGDDDDLGDELDEDIAREIAARRQRHRSKRTKRLLSMQPAPSYHR